MLLALPPQTAPNATSFPRNRDAVRTWLGDLNPTETADDADEFLRGLRHSNRLTNDTEARRSVLEEFRPTLNLLIDNLAQSISPQPQPMAASFRQASDLLDELLREQVNAWKILLSQSSKPSLEDANEAMGALYRTARTAIQQYQDVPKHCIRDANHIYALAESEGLLSTGKNSRDSRDETITSLQNSYAGVLTLATLNLKQIRAKQLDLTIRFLADQFEKVRLSNEAPTGIWRKTQCLINLHSADVPVVASSYIGDTTKPKVRWVDFSAVMEAIETRQAKTRTTLSVTLGADTLERQTLNRLSFEFDSNRTRKMARCISYNTANLSFGHQQISNQLLRDVEAAKYLDDDLHTVEWTQINHSPNGAAFSSAAPEIGTVQVGELVAIKEDGTSTLGVIRWVHVSEDATIQFGMEYLSNEVVPVEITRDNAEEGVTDEALIIACRINSKVTQTILLPGYRFNTGDRLTASQTSRKKHIKLGQCLQSNGMLSHFVINEG